MGGGLVQYSSVLTRLFSQSLSAWTPLPESSLGQQRAYRYYGNTIDDQKYETVLCLVISGQMGLYYFYIHYKQILNASSWTLVITFHWRHHLSRQCISMLLKLFTHCYFSQVFKLLTYMMLYFAHSAVRVAVYRIIELWVRVGGVSLLQGSPSHTELLFTHLLGDITPGSEAVKVRLRVFVSNTISM